MEKVRCVIERITFQNPQNGYSVIKCKAKGYNDILWQGLRQVVALRGLYAKFSQNEELKTLLLDTDNAYLVECAYKDLNWACGWHLDDPQRTDISKWRGKNLLGFALMEVREQLRQGDH